MGGFIISPLPPLVSEEYEQQGPSAPRALPRLTATAGPSATLSPPADFQPGSFGYRPKRSAHDAVHRVTQEVSRGKTLVIDVDLRAYFDSVRHDLLLALVVKRVQDADVLHLLKLILKASGKIGVPQGGVISPVLSNLYLDEVDRMLEKAKEVTRTGQWTHIEYARYADDLVILIDGHPRRAWLL